MKINRASVKLAPTKAVGIHLMVRGDKPRPYTTSGGDNNVGAGFIPARYAWHRIYPTRINVYGMKHFQVRKKIRLPLTIYNQGHAFFITMSTHQRHPWFRRHSHLCKTAVGLMHDLIVDFGMKSYAWCIMPDHLHVLVQGQGVIDFIRMFKGRLTPVARAAEPGRRLWQRSFYDHALRKEESLSDVACYIWENPVRAQIVAEPGEYLWSGSEVWPNWREFYGRG